MIRILVSKQILFENANKLKPQTILSEIQNADDNQIQSRAIKTEEFKTHRFEVEDNKYWKSNIFELDEQTKTFEDKTTATEELITRQSDDNLLHKENQIQMYEHKEII